MKSMRESTGYSCRPWDDMVTFYLFLFPPGCLHGSSTCTELSGHWRLLVLFLLFLIFLATCARLSWSLSFLVLVKLFFRVVSYLTVVLVWQTWDVPRCPTTLTRPLIRTATSTTRRWHSGVMSDTFCLTTQQRGPSSVWLMARGVPICRHATVCSLSASCLVAK